VLVLLVVVVMHELHISGHCALNDGPANGLPHNSASFKLQSSGSVFPLQTGVVVVAVVVVVVEVLVVTVTDVSVAVVVVVALV